MQPDHDEPEYLCLDCLLRRAMNLLLVLAGLAGICAVSLCLILAELHRAMGRSEL